MWQDFKKFALKGNVIDLAVGVVIGGAFSKIVSSLVDNILMPIVGLLLGGFDFTKLEYTYDDATIKYGQFIQNVVDFFIIAFSIFLFIRLLQKFRKKQEVKSEVKAPTTEEKLLSEIRDILKEQQQQKGV
ncbi:large conductance mechanosensitive channel protein MscL [Robertmurraya sp. GLU-23]|jgi:large conductance mechanosensitive channel|nr:large conductance mechanosensitive channel protein MscL [Bacillus sp. Y1]AYA74514.1 large conductance mechanosensitive channel protein MscL [Bacillus sp. Y1]